MEALIASPSFFFPVSNSFSDINKNRVFLPCSSSFPNNSFVTLRKNYCISSTSCSAVTAPSSSTVVSRNSYWMVVLDKPPQRVSSKSDMVDYYVEILAKVLGNEKDAQMSIYDASFDTHFGFCCHIDEDASRQLSRLTEVVSVRPEADYSTERKNYAIGKQKGVSLFDDGTVKHWMVRVDKPGVGIVTKAQMVDHCVQLLSKVLGNEKDAQMCLYHVSWQSKFGFCCDLDEQCTKELAGVPGVLDLVPDDSFESPNKDYEGGSTQDSSEGLECPVKTKKLFITGLSFYTSEKTLRAAFEGFGELVEVKIIMDKISKRSKGYAFIEYTTEEAASAALKEMNGKIINGWLIVVDVAKTKPFKRSKSQTNSEF